MPPTPKKPRPQLIAPPDLEVTYANLARISHSPVDVVIDFAHLMPGAPRAAINARVVLSPISAKLLYQALGENLARYEAAFGEIKIPASSLADQLFRRFHTPNPPDEDSDES